MLVIAALLRATALLIAGYFVWFASSKAEDRLKTVGRYIAIWTFALAAVLVVAGIAGAVMRPHGGMGMGPGMGPMAMHRGMGFEGRDRGPRFFMRRRDEGPGVPKAEETAPAAPAAPAVPAKP